MIRNISILLCLFFILNGTAQSLHFEHYQESDGLSQNSIRDIVQDDKGFLWLGTFGGLNRFDGYDFKVFNSKLNVTDYLHNDDILEIVLDKKNNLWIATDYGLSKYHIPTSSFKTYHANNETPFSLIDNKVRSVYVDKLDRLWVGTKDNGLCYFNDEEEKFHKIDLNGLDNIRSIYQTTNGKIWFTTFKKGAYSFNIDKEGNISHLKRYSLNALADLSQNSFDAYFILEDEFYDIYIGTKGGLYKLNKTKDIFQLINTKNLNQDYFRCYTKAPNGHYWFGTSNGVIECEKIDDIKIGKFKRHIPDLKNTNSLINNYIISLYFDNSGILWIGTENGLDKFDPYENQFKTIKANFTSDGKIPIINSFTKTYDNKLLLGTHSSGLFLKEGNNFEHLLKKYSRISSVYTADSIIFYIGLWSGKVIEYNIKTRKDKLLNVEFEVSPVMSFYKLSNDKLLIGFIGEGLIEYNLKTNSYKAIKKDMSALKGINKIVPTQSNIVWMATEEGVIKYNTLTKEIKNYRTQVDKVSLSNNKVKDLIIDGKGKVWASTRKGLNYYDPLTDNFVVKEDPLELKNSWITDMSIDVDGNMWFNMNYNKIAKYYNKTNELRLFYVNNGVRSNLMNKRGFLHLSDSIIYIGGDKEIIYFSPNAIKENKTTPLPIISEFRIQNKEITPGTVIDGETIMLEDLNYSKQIDLDYNNRNFSLKFSVPSFVKERKNEFQYKLEGFDKEWNTVNSNSRTVQYTNLFPDDYILKIKASNSSGYWSETVSYSINVQPPFWLTYKTFLILAIILTIIFYIVRKQIKNRLQLKNALLMEKVKRDRDEKLNNEKLRFFTNISHELRTPLTLILGPVKQLMEKTDRTEYEKSRIKLIDQNASRLLQLVNQVLDFRRAQTGELKLKVSQTEVVERTRTIFSSFKQMANGKRISFSFNSELAKIDGWIDVDKYNKILFNLLSNALKFTKEYGNVDLFLAVSEEDPTKLVVEVSDDGIGIPKSSQHKVFDRFYQATNSKKNTTGTGIGLSLVKSLVDLHKGKITLESEVDKGTVFTVEIPFNKEHFSKKEIFEVPIKPLQAANKKKLTKVKQNTEVKQRVLLIDDNVEVRKFLVDYLSDSYKVYEADNGKEGLQVCRKVKPDLCVVDVMMPVMDGFQFVEEVKADENISNTAIVMLTALSENENKIKGYSIGVDGYLVKPFDPSLLKTRIENILKIRFSLKQQFSGEIESDVTALAHSQIDVEMISKLTELIEENISKLDLSSTFLCEQLAMSSSKLYRKIKQLTDLSPNEFIRTVRLKKSATLLKTKNYNVSEVSTMVGFNDPLYFSRVFKKQFGYSPSKLIK